MRENQTPLPEVIATKLRGFNRRTLLVAGLRGVAEALLLFGLGLLGLILIEWIAKPALTGRICLSIGVAGLAGLWGIYRVVVPWIRRSSWRQIAQAFEAAAPRRFQERILSAVELAESSPEAAPGVSAWMAHETIQRAAAEVRPINPVDLVNHGPAWKAWRRAAMLLVAIALGCGVPGFVSLLWLALNPYASTAVWSRTVLTVAPGHCQVPQGSSLQIKAQAVPAPDQAKVRIRWNDGYQETALMVRNPTNGFALNLPSVTRGFQYTVQAGDAESLVYTVQTQAPPAITRLQVHVQPPDYALETNRLVEGGSADFLVGSRLRLLVETTGEAIAQVEWLPMEGSPRTLVLEARRLALELQPTNAVTYRLRLTGANHLKAEPAQRWLLRPLPDMPPTARLTALGLEAGLVQRDEIVPFLAEAGDDIGLKKVELLVLGRDTLAEAKILYSFLPDRAGTNAVAKRREFKTAINYLLAGLDASAGDELQFQLAATDLRDQTTRSEPIAITIGARDKALEAQAATRLKPLLGALDAQMDYLRQTRGSWLSIGRNYREDDPGAQRPALTLLKSRLREFSGAVEAVGGQLIAESETNGLADARFMYRLGSTLTAWGPQQSEILVDNCARLDQPSLANLDDLINQGRELFGRALKDLEDYRRALGVFTGVLETDVLATQCESAQGRYKRGLPVMRGDTNQPAADSGPGLRATYFAGVTLEGRILEQKTSLPRIDNDAPAGKRDQWSARFEGDLQVTNTGAWTLACVADDGVRLTIDGKSILPASAWSAHPATEFKAELTLSAGWHPLILEFFQGSGEAKLTFLVAKKGSPLREVPPQWLRPPVTRVAKPESPISVPSAVVKAALNDRVRASLAVPSWAPPSLVPLTNQVQNEAFTRLVREKLPVGESLAKRLTNFPAWKPDELQSSENQADELVVLAREARRFLREELEKYRWRYEGSAALKDVQNAVHELRETVQEMRLLPYHSRGTLTETEQAKVNLMKAWEKELEKSAVRASHRFFEIAKQKTATLAERNAALRAAEKAQKELRPAIAKLEKKLGEPLRKGELMLQTDMRLDEVADRYRELNELQETINREHVAAEARQAFPEVRAFARAQKSASPVDLPAAYQAAKRAVAEVQKNQRIVGDYAGAEKLTTLEGDAPQNAKGKELASEIWGLAMRTDNNPPSLAQTIPPPMREQTVALEKRQTSATESAEELALPRLAMSLEAGRLQKQGDRPTAAAYALLGQDLGELLTSPDRLSEKSLRPLSERAAALAGKKGDAARQAEIKAAAERLRNMASLPTDNQEAIADQLDALSAMSMQAAGDAQKQAPLARQLGEMAGLAPPLADWTESSDPKETAASAANESLTGIQAAPKQWESYNDASRILADAARQVRMDSALRQLGELNPFREPPGDPALAKATSPTPSPMPGPDGLAGKVLPQPAPAGVDQAEWARLQARLRQAIRGSGVENFSEEQQAFIRAYFERLGSDQ